MAERDFDYIVIGSGAGGGPLAANLARAGFKVMLMEAGGDPCLESGDRGRWMYEVPIFHGASTEYDECAWDFYVRHYSDDARQGRDSKVVPDEYLRPSDKKPVIFYPRAGTLGGCTAHNAMITVMPQDSDWNYISQITGDDSWKAEKMNGYFERMENCTYVPRPGSLRSDVSNVLAGLADLKGLFEGHNVFKDLHQGHGFNGWLTTSEADPTLALGDKEIILLLLNAIGSALKGRVGDPAVLAATHFDPNHPLRRRDSPEGAAFTPLAVDNGKRNGPRDYLLRTKKEYPNNLTIQMRSLATKIIFDNTKTAVGVEFMERPFLYKASPKANGAPPAAKKQVTAREVILAGGAFNSPQLLMLSGIGPSQHLKSNGINVLVDLPGVGENLQDRYEVGIISEWKKPFALLGKSTFLPPDLGKPADDVLAQWDREHKGIYSSNGSLIGIIKKSTPDKPEPDLYIFGLPGYFPGYSKGYSLETERFHDKFTWAILKAHTNNTAGRVSLKSNDPQETPNIEFHYFKEGNDAKGEDLDAVVKGVEFVRQMNLKLQDFIGTEIKPGPDNTGDKLRQFIQDEAWGHHASCTNKIGADGDSKAVLDSRFRVRGVKGLRVVDASVFPKIPGYFIVTAVYMVSEKASDVIAEDARRS